MKRLLYHNDDKVLVNVCWALSYLCEDTYGHGTQVLTDAFSDSDVCRLVELAEHPNVDVQLAALTFMSTFSSIKYKYKSNRSTRSMLAHFKHSSWNRRSDSSYD